MSSFKVRNHQERVTEALVEPEVGEDQGETFFYTYRSFTLMKSQVTVVAHTKLSQLALAWKGEFTSP